MKEEVGGWSWGAFTEDGGKRYATKEEDHRGKQKENVDIPGDKETPRRREIKGGDERCIKGVNLAKSERDEEQNTLADDEGSIGWLAVSSWVPKLKSFGGIRERDVESSTGVRALAGTGDGKGYT